MIRYAEIVTFPFFPDTPYEETLADDSILYWELQAAGVPSKETKKGTSHEHLTRLSMETNLP